MRKVKRVLIHQIFDDLANLEDTLDHFNPDYVFLISCVPGRSEPQQALDCMNQDNVKLLGKNVVNVEYCELIPLKKAWHNSTMFEVLRILGEIKEKCEEIAGEGGCEYYAGLSDSGDGGELITVGISFAAVLHDMKTYYTRARKAYYHGEYVIEIENLSKITKTKNWLESKYNTSKNLRYLREIIKFEEQGHSEISAAKIADLDGFETRPTHNALNRLSDKGLINKDGKRNYTVSSTDLGKLAIKAWYPLGNDD